MGKYEAPAFARGESFYNGGSITTTAADLGGQNLEGREYEFEPNSQAQETGPYKSTVGVDPSGRPIRVKAVRNVSGANLKPKRVVKFQAVSTASLSTTPYEGRVDGYVTSVSDRPAGVVDEFLPSAGVPNNDVFYIVIDGPTVVTQAAGSIATALNVGDRVVAATAGTTSTDDAGGRVVLQDLTGATSTLANNVQNAIGYIAVQGVSTTITTSTGATLDAVVHLSGRRA